MPPFYACDFFERCGIPIDIKEPYTFSQYENSDPQADMVIAISQKAGKALLPWRRCVKFRRRTSGIRSDRRSAKSPSWQGQ